VRTARSDDRAEPARFDQSQRTIRIGRP
jgi:hypothetical protein